MSANEQVHYTKIFLKQPLKMLRPPPLHVVTVAQHFQFINFNHDSTFLFLFSLFLGRFLFPQSLLLLIFINLPAPPFLALQWRDTCIKNNARKKKKENKNKLTLCNLHYTRTNFHNACINTSLSRMFFVVKGMIFLFPNNLGGKKDK